MDQYFTDELSTAVHTVPSGSVLVLHWLKCKWKEQETSTHFPSGLLPQDLPLSHYQLQRVLPNTLPIGSGLSPGRACMSPEISLLESSGTHSVQEMQIGGF